MSNRKNHPPIKTPVYVLGENAQTGEAEVKQLNVVQESDERQTRFKILSIDPNRLLRAIEARQDESQPAESISPAQSPAENLEPDRTIPIRPA